MESANWPVDFFFFFFGRIYCLCFSNNRNLKDLKGKARRELLPGPLEVARIHMLFVCHLFVKMQQLNNVD